MAIPRSSAEYYQRQQRLLALLLTAVRQAWRRMDPLAPRWQEQYDEDGVGAQLLMLVAAAQVAAARDADAYIAAVLAELDIVTGPTTGLVVPAAFAGVAGDGRPAATLLAYAIPRAGARFNQLQAAGAPDIGDLERPEWVSDAVWESLTREHEERLRDHLAREAEQSAQQALADAGRWVETVAATMVIDTARAAESAATTAHPGATGYVRMLNPPSCSRCAVLAGKFYRWNEGFERHPLCDCRHIPATEAIAGDLTVNPHTYFESLSAPDQDRIFTVDGARAIRDGADIGQVVNARRGMEKAQVYGRDVLMTREGITRRGQYGRARGGFEKQRGRRYQASTHVRLMPESIYEVADDHADAIRLLKLHRFIT
ncbi:hypothetical protein [Pimelobacter simplex]|uniref:hypothetical protein n=1 Tax=Nocardioides simplex TaxID=2045 RepID=UPI0021505CE3|nr:hypothetical protein [Pimelobacter simplex]UUW88392.1 hypothetical protein M0M43_21970 [Pimelobacter simplex]UUW97896.1 hypothetical protein M0M48_10615 [Pimelobacter simplex]